jgi:hypothetical protein
MRTILGSAPLPQAVRWPSSESSAKVGSSTQGVAVSKTNIYAATYGGLSVSIDEGYSRKNHIITDPRYSCGVRSAALSGSVVCAGSPLGLSISTDQGETWENCPTPSVDGDTDNDILGLAVSGSRVYVASPRAMRLSQGTGRGQKTQSQDHLAVSPPVRRARVYFPTKRQMR